MIWKNKNKITNFFGVALVLALSFCFFGKEANAGYEYEAVSFYAQSSPSAYAVEGTAFWAHTSQKENSLPVYRFFILFPVMKKQVWKTTPVPVMLMKERLFGLIPRKFPEQSRFTDF